MLMPLVTLPLMIPSLIFGTAAANSAHPAAFYMIFAMLLAALPLAPLGTGLALRAAAE
jgi:heme exporter protein B